MALLIFRLFMLIYDTWQTKIWTTFIDRFPSVPFIVCYVECAVCAQKHSIACVYRQTLNFHKMHPNILINSNFKTFSCTNAEKLNAFFVWLPEITPMLHYMQSAEIVNYQTNTNRDYEYEKFKLQPSAGFNLRKNCNFIWMKWIWMHTNTAILQPSLSFRLRHRIQSFVCLLICLHFSSFSFAWKYDIRS